MNGARRGGAPRDAVTRAMHRHLGNERVDFIVRGARAEPHPTLLRVFSAAVVGLCAGVFLLIVGASAGDLAMVGGALVLGGAGVALVLLPLAVPPAPWFVGAPSGVLVVHGRRARLVGWSAFFSVVEEGNDVVLRGASELLRLSDVADAPRVARACRVRVARLENAK